jgi:hypothetical protein
MFESQIGVLNGFPQFLVMSHWLLLAIVLPYGNLVLAAVRSENA